MDLHVVEVESINTRAAAGERVNETEEFRKANVYAPAGGDVAFNMPSLPGSERTDDPVENLGRAGGYIADAVARGITSGRGVVVAGGNCGSLPGIIGGFQQGLGATARIGLVWFDAHGDFNTPRTTLSGMLGGMPVAVSAGLCYPRWRALSHQIVPLSTDRIVMWDVRNLDPEEERLIRSTDVAVIRRDQSLAEAVTRLAGETDFIYLHIDLDILDESLTPTHGTKEPNGPDMAETLQAVEAVVDSGKMGALGLVSTYASGPNGEITLNSGIELLRESIRRWTAA